MAAEEEIGARLSLKGRRKFSNEADAAARDIDKVGDAGTKSGKKMGAAGKVMLGVMAAGAAGALGLAKVSVDAFGQVEAATNTIRVGTGATGEALDALVGSAHNVASQVPAAYDDVSTAVADLNTRLGLTGKPLEDMAGQFLELSRITGTEVSGNIANMTRVFGDWGIEADKQAGAMDAIFRASQSTGASVDSLSQSVVQFGAPLRQMGFGFEEGLAMFGKWEKEGVNAELVMGGMRQALGKLAKAGEDAPTAFRRLSSEIAAMEDPSEATGLAMELFGARAGPDMAAAIREGRFEIDATLSAITDGTDTIMAAGKETMTLSDRWTMLKNKATPALASLGGGLVGLGENVVDLVSQSDSIAGFGVALGGLFGWEEDSAETDALITTLEDLWSTAQEVFSGIEGAVTTMGDAASATYSFLTSDTLASQAAIAVFGTVVGAVLLGQIVLWVRAGVAATISKAKQLQAWLMLRLGAIKSIAVQGGAFIATVAGWTLMAVTATVNAGIMAAAWFIALGPVGWAIGLLVLLGGAFITLWKTSDTFRANVKKNLAAIGAAAGAVKNEVVTSFNNMVSFFSGLPNRISGATRGLWDGIKTAFKSAINWIIDKWNNLSFGIPAVSVAGKEIFGGTRLDTPNIPRLHQGGSTVTGGSAIIQPDEEIVVLPPAATVVPLDNRPAIAAATGSQQGPITLQVVLDRRVVAEAVYEYTGDRVARR